jgi:hypothetical protein
VAILSSKVDVGLVVLVVVKVRDRETGDEGVSDILVSGWRLSEDSASSGERLRAAR